MASQGLVLQSRERLQRWLEECPAFPDLLVNEVTARETYVGQKANYQPSSEIVARQNNPKGVIQDSVTDSDERKRNYPFQPFVHKEMVDAAHGQENQLSFSGTIKFPRRISAPRGNAAAFATAPQKNAALVATAPRKGAAPPDNANFSPGVERKRN